MFTDNHVYMVLTNQYIGILLFFLIDATISQIVAHPQVSINVQRKLILERQRDNEHSYSWVELRFFSPFGANK